VATITDNLAFVWKRLYWRKVGWRKVGKEGR